MIFINKVSYVFYVEYHLEYRFSGNTQPMVCD